MKRHYKGDITIAVDCWGENEEEAIESYFYDLRKKGEDPEVLEFGLDCVEEDDTDDIDYALDCEYESFKEKMNDSAD